MASLLKDFVLSKLPLQFCLSQRRNAARRPAGASESAGSVMSAERLPHLDAGRACQRDRWPIKVIPNQTPRIFFSSIRECFFFFFFSSVTAIHS